MALDINQQDLKDISKRLWVMAARIRHFKAVDIGATLSAWQTEDMHRHRPFTKRLKRAGKASTLIRPHSKYEMTRARKAASRLRRRRKPPRPRTSTRPILREELYVLLQKRLAEALHQKIHW
jgi:hypothetical protein